MARGDGAGDRAGVRHRHADATALAGRQVHAARVRGEGHRPQRARAEQDLRGEHQGAVPALPQGAGQARREDRRHTQAARLHLTRTRLHLTRKGRCAMTADGTTANGTIEKVSIIVSKGSIDGIYPALIMANGARAEGIEANLFFTFFGLDAIHKARHEHIKLATVGNPGLHLATWAGGLPGVSSVMTHYMA